MARIYGWRSDTEALCGLGERATLAAANSTMTFSFAGLLSFWAGNPILEEFHVQEFQGVTVLFVAGFGPIVRDRTGARALYGDTLNVSFKEEQGGYLHTEALQGVQSFALWPLEQAAQSCFGKDSWPEDTPVPQAWLEFDVDDVEAATAELESRGYRVLVRIKKEPWGQTVTRFLSPEGLLVGLTITPWMRH
jgi:hypothetical protein